MARSGGEGRVLNASSIETHGSLNRKGPVLLLLRHATHSYVTRGGEGKGPRLPEEGPQVVNTSCGRGKGIICKGALRNLDLVRWHRNAGSDSFLMSRAPTPCFVTGFVSFETPRRMAFTGEQELRGVSFCSYTINWW